MARKGKEGVRLAVTLTVADLDFIENLLMLFLDSPLEHSVTRRSAARADAILDKLLDAYDAALNAYEAALNDAEAKPEARP